MGKVIVSDLGTTNSCGAIMDGPNADVIIAYQGAVAPEAIAATGLLAEDRRDVGLLAITSADRLNAGWQAAEIVARAQAQAGTARAEAAVQSRALTAAENTRMEAERDRELEVLRARAETRMPDYNDRVVAAARALLEEFCESLAEPRDAAARR